jgi:hypothetical protein
LSRYDLVGYLSRLASAEHLDRDVEKPARQSRARVGAQQGCANQIGAASAGWIGEVSTEMQKPEICYLAGPVTDGACVYH